MGIRSAALAALATATPLTGCGDDGDSATQTRGSNPCSVTIPALVGTTKAGCQPSRGKRELRDREHS